VVCDVTDYGIKIFPMSATLGNDTFFMSLK
jgi:hypothetical protein